MTDRRPPIAASAPSVLGTWTRTVVRALDARGLDGREIAVRAGIDPAALDDPDARNPIATTTRLWKLSVEATGDPGFGLWASRFVTPTTFHALSFAALASPTLRDAFLRFVRYGRLVSDAADTELVTMDGNDRLRLTLPEGAGRPADEAIDAILSLVARTAWTLSARAVRPLAVRLERPRPVPSEPFAEAFRAPVEFGQNENSLEFSHADLDRPLPAGNAELARSNDEVLARYLSRVERERASSRLRAWFVDHLSAGSPDAGAAARAMGMSLRSLQRRLSEQGTSFREVLQDTRLDLARSYLTEGRYSVTEIAFLLGFADSSGFARAFRRHTGVAPSSYVEALSHARR
jgi:AraC-like DNA-binding protein